MPILSRSLPFRLVAIGVIATLGASSAPMRADDNSAFTNFSQAPQKSYRDRMTDKFSQRTIAPHWIEGSDAFWYRVDNGGGTSQFVVVDAANKTRKLAFDHQKVAAALTKELKKPVRAEELPFAWIDYDVTQKTTRFRTGGQVWQLSADGTLERSDGDVNEEKLEPLAEARATRKNGEATAITFLNRTGKELELFWIDSENNKKSYGKIAAGATLYRTTFAGHVWQVFDGTKSLGAWEAPNDEALVVLDNSGSTGAVKPQTESDAPKNGKGAPKKPEPRVFVKDYNVWVRDADGTAKKLTTNGSKADAFKDLYLAPDGRHLVAWQVQPEQDSPLTLIDSSPKDQLQPKVKVVQYLKPGDRVKIERPRMFDLQTGREIATSDAMFANPYDVADIGWNPASDEYHFRFNERGHQNYRVISMNTAGKVRAIVDEHSDTFIDYYSKIYFDELPATNELIWASERDGWNHLYLYDMATGAVKNQITKGDWLVREVEKVDEAKRQIWFRGFGMVPGQDPYYAQLARINFDGSGLTLLTEGDGDHKWKWSPGHKYFIDTYSRVDMAPVTNLRDADGTLITALESADLKPLANAGWSMPERFVAKGRDGVTDIYGFIIKPSNFDPNKEYPVLENIYAGPHGFFVPKAFSTMDNFQDQADRGYVIVKIDGMGTNWRNRAFHDVAWKNVKDAGFPDRIAWMKAAQRTRPWMDLSRVGIYGVSAGAQSAMGALIWHGDFYKAAAADCGCHDNRMDKISWNEQWMGWPVDKSYAENSNLEHAAQLQGHLFLTVGELDTNVDPSSTTQVVNALIKADKDFEYILFPGGGHGAGGSAYGMRRRNAFFDRWLQPGS